jgi:hypothetical protein
MHGFLCMQFRPRSGQFHQETISGVHVCFFLSKQQRPLLKKARVFAKKKHGEDLYRIAALGRIVGSAHKNHFSIIKKSETCTQHTHTDYIYNSKKKFSSKFDLQMEIKKKITSISTILIV